jgi:hypothetical protein
MAIPVMANQAAIAQTTTLICRLDPPQSQGFVEDEPSTLELNEAQSSVVVHFSAETVTASGGRLPAYLTGKRPATFAADTIFSVPHYSDANYTMSYTINRLTGSWVSSSGLKRTCQVGKRQF